jgi:FkbM family methyltransferase
MIVLMLVVVIAFVLQIPPWYQFMHQSIVISNSMESVTMMESLIVIPTTTSKNAAGAGVGGRSAFGNAFKMTERLGKWRMWDASYHQPLLQDEVSCIWTDFKPFSSLDKNETSSSYSRMCRYPVETDEYVSGKLMTIGRFEDCDNLPSLWREATEKYSFARQHTLKSNKTMIYLDVGGNIGSCVMEMLHSTDDAVNIVVFEPHPHNLAQLTRTIHGLAPHFRNRVVVFPIGVGDVTDGNFTMHMASNNRGNSVIGPTPIKDAPSQEFLRPTSIFVERLNDIFNADEVVIPLMKMDIQGFECKAWDGMSSILPVVDIIKTEAERKFLIGQGCRPQELRKRISIAGFTFKGRLNIIAKRNSSAMIQENE